MDGAAAGAAAHLRLRFASGRTPWDFGGVPGVLRDFLAKHPGADRRALVLGCGSGYEVAAFAAAGWDTTAIDFSPAAVARARTLLGPALAPCVVLGDFFSHPFTAGSFDLVYERTFLCALSPERWPAIATRVAALLKLGGALVGIHYFADKEDGPPFGLAPSEDEQLFARDFELVRDEPVADSLPLFAGKERWQVHRRV